MLPTVADCVIVSRHPAAIEYICFSLVDGCADQVDYLIGENSVRFFGRADTESAGHDFGEIPIIRGNATPGDVYCRKVFGNIPLDLASYAREVWSIVFPPGKAPRGAEYSLQDMLNAGARLFGTLVHKLDQNPSL